MQSKEQLMSFCSFFTGKSVKNYRNIMEMTGPGLAIKKLYGTI
jgi:hypothetical protein